MKYKQKRLYQQLVIMDFNFTLSFWVLLHLSKSSVISDTHKCDCKFIITQTNQSVRWRRIKLGDTVSPALHKLRYATINIGQ